MKRNKNNTDGNFDELLDASEHVVVVYHSRRKAAVDHGTLSTWRGDDGPHTSHRTSI